MCLWVQKRAGPDPPALLHSFDISGVNLFWNKQELAEKWQRAAPVLQTLGPGGGCTGCRCARSVFVLNASHHKGRHSCLAGLALVDASRDKTEEIRRSDDGSVLVVPADSPSQGSQHSCRVLSFSSPPKPSSPSRRSPVQPKWGNVVSPSTLFLTSLLEFLSPLSHTRGPP